MASRRLIVSPVPDAAERRARPAVGRPAETLAALSNSKPNARPLLEGMARSLRSPLALLLEKPSANEPVTEDALARLDASTAAVLIGVGD